MRGMIDVGIYVNKMIRKFKAQESFNYFQSKFILKKKQVLKDNFKKKKSGKMILFFINTER